MEKKKTTKKAEEVFLKVTRETIGDKSSLQVTGHGTSVDYLACLTAAVSSVKQSTGLELERIFSIIRDALNEGAISNKKEDILRELLKGILSRKG